MPEIRRYTVTEIREVSVSANSAADANRIAAVAFQEGQNSIGGIGKAGLPDVWGNTISQVRTVALGATEEV
jgi:hypothetical protein